jgi:hypothetical protein
VILSAREGQRDEKREKAVKNAILGGITSLKPLGNLEHILDGV